MKNLLHSVFYFSLNVLHLELHTKIEKLIIIQPKLLWKDSHNANTSRVLQLTCFEYMWLS
jgi:hypothetical protein